MDVRLVCEERDRLWAEYDVALRAYIRAVNHMATTFDPDTEVAVEHTRAIVDETRDEIRRHCRQCGCDLEYVKALSDGKSAE